MEYLRPLVQLTLARFREQLRQPEVLFWVFAFPLLLAVALGLAFRNRPPDVVRVAVEAGPGADSLAAALESASGFAVSVLPAGTAAERLRTGRGRRRGRARAGRSPTASTRPGRRAAWPDWPRTTRFSARWDGATCAPPRTRS